MRVVPESPGTNFVRARPTSSTAASLPALAPTTTKPSGNGVIDKSSHAPAWVRVVPFGTGSSGQTVTVRVTGWTIVSTLWVPVILCEFTATLSTCVGVAGSDVTNSENFADTVSAPITNFGDAGVDCQPKSPQNATPPHYIIDACGCSVFQIDTALGTATAGNALLGTA